MAVSPLYDGLGEVLLLQPAHDPDPGLLEVLKAIMKWGDRHTKCIQLEIDYVEKS